MCISAYNSDSSNSIYRAFFKKWLEIERRIGDAQGAETVKEKAIAWTQRAVGLEETD